MADDSSRPPTPPKAAADKPASDAPAEPLKGEVSRTDAPGAGASAAPPAPPKEKAAPPAPKPINPAAEATATTAEASSARIAEGRTPEKGATAPKLPPRPAPAAGAKAEHKPAAAPPSGPPDPPPPADVAAPAFLATLQATLGDAIEQMSYWVGDWTVIVRTERLLDVARHLRDTRGAAFDFCSDVTASDWPTRARRFDVIYSLYSTRHRHRIRIKVRAGENDPVASVTSVWPSANWLEREVYDLFGVRLVGHPDLRRILMPDEWQGHPQRKDYPLEGPGELLMESPTDWLRLRTAQDVADIE